MTDGDKETIKLRASYFNGIAIALAAVSGIAPYVAVSQAGNIKALIPTLFFALGFVWFSLRAHQTAIKIVKSLDN